jgi:urease accessory protein
MTTETTNAPIRSGSLPIAAKLPDLPDRGGGAATLAFALRDGRTRLADLGQRTPLRVLFPTPPPDDIPTAAIMNTGGGLVAGDRIDVSVEVGAGARALVMAGAAEKVYRSTGPTTLIEGALRVAPGAWLEWLPQETILFAESRLARRLRLDVAGDGRATAGEILVLGRLARGERARSGLVRDAIEVRRDGRLIWADALHLDGDYGPVLDSRSGFGGALAVATYLHVAPDAARHVDAARAALDASASIASHGPTPSGVAPGVRAPDGCARDSIPDRGVAGSSGADGGGGGDLGQGEAATAHVDPGLRAGVTCVNGVLVARWLADDPRRLRASFRAFWARMRHELAGLPARLPRLWEV